MSLVLTSLAMRLAGRLGIFGVDVHKHDRPLVPKLGGLGFVLTFITLTSFTYYVYPELNLAPFIIAPTVATLIGLLEDFRELNPLLKPTLLATPGIPIVMLGLYDPMPELPFIGGVRLTILYPLLVLVAYSVVTNAVNSIDVLNGSLVAMSIPTLVALGALAYVTGDHSSTIASAILIGGLVGFLRYNWFPAKTFSGNSGSVLVGSVIATIAITAKLEVLSIIALIPFIMNEFYLLVSMGGIRSGKLLRVRPIKIGYDGFIYANADLKAPLTLVRMIVASKPLDERGVVLRMAVLSLYSASLAIATYALDEVIAL